MRTLCIDTSAGSAVALHDDDAGVLARARSADHRGHAERLSALVAEVLETAGLSASDVDRVAVGTGPAPYTGLRVGLVTALTFARARRIPVHGVSSLDVLARQVLDVRPGSTVLVLGDARRKEVYSARYRALGQDDVEVLSEPRVGPAAELAEDPLDAAVDEGPVVVAGPGALLYADVLPPTPGTPDEVDAAVLARVVRARLARAEAGEEVALGTEPLYLRRPDVTPAAARKRAS
ncbi:tRNA (adenosine(37)-N6)-threonylcarbamoyltransferase complex dimerization subunit type 1 TsaB [Georgenia satyanarayanai]|uniref:tRNA (adenosine(37)-N6)-threonylcarbamoyltransferase complex dimerization subunit type 1 TsaB n=1 Tax=Georgenia satyanarayanai TaxID=860221 RepID=UPI00203C56E2|nr:tRNA (adenosine(37)-N6)-threonylcarbamoyltransferase complex dimerization subunit type 1 TsaB [Georgenia satyanarayanai]MCM3660768.1 tRNA (adenosine(37)-N6)-threonylcarbamoyltransferase complex dimerization subunit type 1 TsaB [Georgenia satyanarayanai]